MLSIIIPSLSAILSIIYATYRIGKRFNEIDKRFEELKRYVDKDPKEFTLKEAEEFRELGRKAIVEYWDRPEAYKLHLYTCIIYGLTLRKVYEEKEKKRKWQEVQQ